MEKKLRQKKYVLIYTNANKLNKMIDLQPYFTGDAKFHFFNSRYYKIPFFIFGPID